MHHHLSSIIVYADKGVSALWKGSIPALFGAMSENIVAFGINGILKRLLDVPSSSTTSSTTVNGKKASVEVQVWRPLCYGAITGREDD